MSIFNPARLERAGTGSFWIVRVSMADDELFSFRRLTPDTDGVAALEPIIVATGIKTSEEFAVHPAMAVSEP